ncbi:MAG: creatininase family protein [Anaerolineales bacterium]|jgi:creatinine amidohydrolase
MDLIYYADLTWPEVEKLPRDLPMLVPIGLEDYDLRAAAKSISTEQVVILPAIPYGFQHTKEMPLSRLDVRPGLMNRVLTGISGRLKSQGFTRVYFLNGHGNQNLKGERHQIIDFPYRQQYEFLWPQHLATRVVVISTGHTEQHGYHLPLSTDSLIVEALATHLTTLSPDEVFCLPVWPYGVSTHTDEFPATLNLGGRVFEDFFLAVIQQLVAMGAQMIYFSNGHGGNHSFLVNVVKFAGERYPQAFIATQWLHTTGPELSLYRESATGGMGHGGELETSYILNLRPDLVKMDLATREVDFVSTPNYYMDWIDGGSLVANPPWLDDTTSGIYGDAIRGTAEKGRLWLQAAVNQKLAIIQEIQTQQDLRQQKRAQH